MQKYKVPSNQVHLKKLGYQDHAPLDTWLLVSFFLFVRCTDTHTCDVCKKEFENIIATRAPFTHPTSVCSLFVSAYILMHSHTQNPHFTYIYFRDFCCKHNNLNKRFASRTLYLSQTNVLVIGWL